MEKRKYYVNIGTKEISQIPYGNNTTYTIEANGEEVFQLREKFNEVFDDELGTFVRAHIPFLPYHQDSENQEYDKDLQDIFQMIYQLATMETRQAMKEAGMTIADNEYNE